jgi:outer membrane protein assembly factor BamB
MKSSRVVLFTTVVLLLATLVTVSAAAQTLTLSPKIGQPTAPLAVRGDSFGSSETVDVYFDETDLAVGSTNLAGSFSVKINAPSSAVPGKHWITAIGQESGLKAQASFAVYTNWKQAGHDAAHSACNQLENVLNPGNVGSLGVRWSRTGGGSISVASGVLYLQASDALYALNANTGAELWHFTQSGAPAVGTGVVYVAADALYALRATNGALLWKYTPGGTSNAPPAVANGMLYFGSSDGNLYAVNATSGSLVWKVPGYGGTPTVAKGVVYIGGYVTVALSADTGALLWMNDVAGGGSPMVANGVVYVETSTSYLGNDTVNALDANTGALLWSDVFLFGMSEATLATAGNLVYYAGELGDFTYAPFAALDASTGGIVWANYFDHAGFPSVANGVLYGVVNDNLTAFDANSGVQLWQYPITSYSSSPVVASGMVYFTDSASTLYAFGLTGDAQAKTRPPGRPNPNSLQRGLSVKPAATVTSASGQSQE